jgi:hypothetical protein
MTDTVIVRRVFLKSARHRDAIVLPGDFRDGLYVVAPHGHSVVVRPAQPRQSV